MPVSFSSLFRLCNEPQYSGLLQRLPNKQKQTNPKRGIQMRGKIVFKIESFQNGSSFCDNEIFIIDKENTERENPVLFSGMFDTIFFCITEFHHRRKEEMEIHIKKVLPGCKNCKYYTHKFFTHRCEYQGSNICTNNGEAWCHNYQKKEVCK